VDARQAGRGGAGADGLADTAVFPLVNLARVAVIAGPVGTGIPRRRRG
jgi:hypothetical protein